MSDPKPVAAELCDHCRTPRHELARAGGMTLCLECFGERQTGVLRPQLAAVSVSHQDQDQDQDQVLNTTRPYVPPGPGVKEDGSGIPALEAAWRAGDLEPVDVQLGPMPPHAGKLMRAIAEHLRFRMGLRRAVGDTRPLPYATNEAVKAGIVPDKGAASHALRALVRAEVVEHVGSLPPTRPLIDGTKLYAPPGGGS